MSSNVLRRWPWVAAAFIIVLSLLAQSDPISVDAQTAPTPPPPVGLVLVPSAGPPGTVVKIIGTGLPAGSSAGLHLGGHLQRQRGNGIPIDCAPANYPDGLAIDQKGSLLCSFVADYDPPLGDGVGTVTLSLFGQLPLSLQAQFTITGGPVATGGFIVGSAGTAIPFKGTGFKQGSLAAFMTSEADGTVTTISSTCGSTKQGCFAAGSTDTSVTAYAPAGLSGTQLVTLTVNNTPVDMIPLVFEYALGLTGVTPAGGTAGTVVKLAVGNLPANTSPFTVTFGSGNDQLDIDSTMKCSSSLTVGCVVSQAKNSITVKAPSGFTGAQSVNVLVAGATAEVLGPNSFTFDSPFITNPKPIVATAPQPAGTPGPAGTSFVLKGGNFIPPKVQPFTADQVLGQGSSGAALNSSTAGTDYQSLTNPTGMTVDGAGNVYVADTGNNRVVRFPYDSNTGLSQYIDSVWGQQDPYSGAAGVLGGLNGPTAVALDQAGDVYVADTGNNRIVKYAGGQFYGNTTLLAAWSASAIAALPLNAPQGVVVAANNDIYVSDTGNNRIVRYTSGGLFASQVWGQPDFVSNAAGTTSTALSGPTGLTLDGSGNGTLLVADTGNNRVLRFPGPASGTPTADKVWGQGAAGTAFTIKIGATSPTGMKAPRAVLLDAGGRMYVADTGNNRVIRFAASPTGPAQNATAVFGQGAAGTAYTKALAGPVSATSASAPVGVGLSPAGEPYLSDSGDNRVLAFPFVTGAQGPVQPQCAGAVCPHSAYVPHAGNTTIVVTFTSSSDGTSQQTNTACTTSVKTNCYTVSATQLKVTPPAGLVGLYTIGVTVNGLAATAQNSNTFVDFGPAITGMTVSSNKITLSGGNFPATKTPVVVMFENTPIPATKCAAGVTSNCVSGRTASGMVVYAPKATPSATAFNLRVSLAKWVGPGTPTPIPTPFDDLTTNGACYHSGPTSPANPPPPCPTPSPTP